MAYSIFSLKSIFLHVSTLFSTRYVFKYHSFVKSFRLLPITVGSNSIGMEGVLHHNTCTFGKTFIDTYFAADTKRRVVYKVLVMAVLLTRYIN